MNYIEEAIKTESIDHFTVPSPRLLHVAFGVSTEVAEILLATDEINLREETGDVCWYMAIACNEFGILLDDLAALGSPEGPPEQRLLRGAADALDYMKKCCFYGKEFDPSVFAGHLGTTMLAIYELVDSPEDLERILQTNIDKLRARYGEKFTTEAAEVRDLEREREILRGAS